MAASKALSLVQRDPFFDDAFFTDAWGDFDKAIQSILDKFDNKGLQVDTGNRNTCTQVYRNIRTTNIDKDLYASQALQVTEKDGKFQCVMDVKDFSPNDLQVKVVDDRVVVEGKYEKKSEDGTSMTSKSFYREFTLPQQANIELVSTALSKDGVLTIKAPKKDGEAVPANTVSSVSSSQQVEQSSNVQKDSSSSVEKKTSIQQSSSVKQSFSSSSTFSSTKKTSIQSSSTVSSGVDSVEDMSSDMDRLVFTHDNVNLKLQNK